MKIKGKYSSVWDVNEQGCGCVITTDCEIDLETGAIEAEAASEEESMSVETLDRVFIEVDGREFTVKYDEDGDQVENLQVLRDFVTQSGIHSPA